MLESVYETVLAYELRKRGLHVQRQLPVPIVCDDIQFDEGYRLDLLVEDKVIVEVKSVEEVDRVHKKQLLTYLRLMDKRLGLLINFNVDLIEGWHHAYRESDSRRVNRLASSSASPRLCVRFFATTRISRSWANQQALKNSNGRRCRTAIRWSACRIFWKSSPRRPSCICARRAPAAWIAACRFARANRAARSTTSFPSGTTWSIRAAGRTRSTGCTRRTTSPSSPAAPAPRRAKGRACWGSPIRR